MLNTEEIGNLVASLPEKGDKRVEAIKALGADGNNAPALMELAQSEKGKCKTAAQKTLAQLDYPPAAKLWNKLVRGKFMGEDVLMPSSTDCVSDEAAPVISDYLSSLFSLPEGTVLELEQFDNLKFCISLMLGKATPKMMEIYRLAAKNARWIGAMDKKEPYGLPHNGFWHFNGTLRLWNATPEELQKLFPMLLASSIIRSMDQRLTDLAEELFETYGGSWLIPVIVRSILSDPPQDVYETYSPLLSDNSKAAYLYNALGMLYYDDPLRHAFDRIPFPQNEGGYKAYIFWGDADTKCVFSRKANLDERWIWKLCENPDETKPRVTYQSYNRSGVKYEDYDEMLLELLPLKIEQGPLNVALSGYFSVRAKNDDGATQLFSDAMKRLTT